MPRYFFHSEDGLLEHDETGTELADASAAREQAVRFAGALLAERPQAMWEGTRWRLLVTDEQSLILFTIEVSTMIGVPPLHPPPRRTTFSPSPERRG